MAKQLNIGGSNDSVTPSTRSLNQKLGTSPKPRTLSASEIGLLRQSKQEIHRSSTAGQFVIRGTDKKSTSVQVADRKK